jgi:hypothetical protein
MTLRMNDQSLLSTCTYLPRLASRAACRRSIVSASPGIETDDRFVTSRGRSAPRSLRSGQRPPSLALSDRRQLRALIWSEAVALASVAKEHYKCGSESSPLSPLR